MMDRVVMKAVELGCAHKTFDILKNHQFFFYYPHYDTVYQVAKSVIEADSSGEHILVLTGIIGNCSLIKLNQDIMDLFRGIDVEEKEFLSNKKKAFELHFEMIESRFAYLNEN